MSPKILAFTSCLDTVNDAKQAGWTDLLQHRFDELLLLGDTMYMDYGLGHQGEPNGEPQRLPLPQFSARMHQRYEAQWNVPSFKAVLRGHKVHALWDDHDFAWNSARGGGDEDGKFHVRPPVRALSRRHFQQFRDALETPDAPYPANPAPDGNVPVDAYIGIQDRASLADGVLLHLLDGRSFREAPGGHLLGRAQRDELEAALVPDRVHVIASATTLKDWKRDHRDDYRWLLELSESRRILVLSGDVHEPDFRTRGARLHEATASALAQPPGVTAILGKRTQVFGLLSIAADALTVELFHRGQRIDLLRIDRESWTVDDLD